jgi:Galactose oxidase, central domain/Kelch motif
MELKELYDNLVQLKAQKKNENKGTISESYWECKWKKCQPKGNAYIVAGQEISVWGCAGAVKDSKLYIFGTKGTHGGPKNSLLVLDMPTNTLACEEYPVKVLKERYGHSIISYKDLLLLFGGKGLGCYFNDTWAFNVEGKAWEQVRTTGAPGPRGGHASCVVGNCMIVYGGKGTGLLSDVWALNLVTYEWKNLEDANSELTKRQQMGGVALDSTVYIFGGTTSEDNTNDFFSIIITKTRAFYHKITPSSKTPQKRSSCSLSNLYNKYLLLFGGENKNHALNDIWAYNIKKNQWNEILPINQIEGRIGHLSYVYKNSLIVFGGVADLGITKGYCILDFGVLGKCAPNDTGFNYKRKGVKCLSTGMYYQMDSTQFYWCHKCIELETCLFVNRQHEIWGFTLHNFPKVNIDLSKVFSSLQDPFSSILAIGDCLKSSVVFVKTQNFVEKIRNYICKTVPALKPISFSYLKRPEGDKDHNKRQNILNTWKSTPTKLVLILELYADTSLTPEELSELTSNEPYNFIQSIAILSDTGLIISNSEEFFIIALISQSDIYAKVFFVVYNKDRESLYPCKDLIYPTVLNICSRSHLNFEDWFAHPYGTTVYVYTKDIETKNNDLYYKGRSFLQFALNSKSVKYIINN